jgi:hypothetical protein
MTIATSAGSAFRYALLLSSLRHQICGPTEPGEPISADLGRREITEQEFRRITTDPVNSDFRGHTVPCVPLSTRALVALRIADILR